MADPVIPAGHCELVVGPEHLSRVVVGAMLKAQASLEIMTADLKAMLVPDASAGTNSAPSIVEHWVRLAKRGVEIRILHAGVPSGPALEVIKHLKPADRERITLRRCPRQHAKVIVIDAATCYLGSANLTGAGLGAKGPHKRNVEMGILTRASEMVEAVQDEFNRVWEGGLCDGCLRKDVCPVPLEEPDLG